MEIINEKSITLKIILAGPHNSGKTMLLWKWNKGTGEFSGNPTIGADFVRKNITINDVKYKIHMWDTAGQETYQSITAPYFRLCNGVLLVFDLADSESFNKLNYWLDMIHENTKEKPIIFLIGNKVDIGRQSVSNEEIQSFCSKNQIKFFKTSALTGKGVDEVVDEMINHIVNEGQYTKAYLQRINIEDENEESKSCC